MLHMSIKSFDSKCHLYLYTRSWYFREDIFQLSQYRHKSENNTCDCTAIYITTRYNFLNFQPLFFNNVYIHIFRFYTAIGGKNISLILNVNKNRRTSYPKFVFRHVLRFFHTFFNHFCRY